MIVRLLRNCSKMKFYVAEKYHHDYYEEIITTLLCHDYISKDNQVRRKYSDLYNIDN